MAKKDQLAPLINSLTAAEKKYFVQFTSLRSDEKSYMKLYEAVLKSGTYDAETLSKQLNKTKANLAHEKEYLMENILKALRNYHDKSKDIVVNNYLSDLVLLREKGLDYLAEARGLKGIKAAEQQHRYEAKWRLALELRLSTSVIATTKEHPKKSERAIEQLQDSLKELTINTGFHELFLEAEQRSSVKIYDTTKAEIRQTKRAIAHPLLKRKFSKVLYIFYQHQLLSDFHQRAYNKNISLTHMEKALAIVEKHPEKIPIDTYGYFLMVHSVITKLIAISAITKANYYINRILKGKYKSLPFNATELKKLFAAYSYGYRLSIQHSLIKQNKLNATVAQSLLSNLDIDYHRINPELSINYHVLLQSRAAFLHFYLKNYSASLLWLNRIINEGGNKLVMELQSTARIAMIITHLELGNDSIIPHLVTSVARFLQKHSLYFSMEKTILSFLLKISKLANKKEKKAAFSKLKNELNNANQSPEVKKSMSRFYYMEWIERNLK